MYYYSDGVRRQKRHSGPTYNNRPAKIEKIQITFVFGVVVLSCKPTVRRRQEKSFGKRRVWNLLKREDFPRGVFSAPETGFIAFYVRSRRPIEQYVI